MILFGFRITKTASRLSEKYHVSVFHSENVNISAYILNEHRSLQIHSYSVDSHLSSRRSTRDSICLRERERNATWLYQDK